MNPTENEEEVDYECDCPHFGEDCDTSGDDICQRPELRKDW